MAHTIEGQFPDHARPSSGGVQETGCREAAMAGKRLFSGGAGRHRIKRCDNQPRPRLSIANQNNRPPAILRCASALAHPKSIAFGDPERRVQPPRSRSKGRP